MPHALITGVSESGKTTLAKALAWQWRRRGTGVIVMDPMFSRWPADVQFPEPEPFLAYVSAARSCAVFCDEAGEALDRDRTFNKLATKMRHRGHEIHFLAQFPTQLTPAIRTNCSRLYAFRIDKDGADTLAKTWTQAPLKDLVINLGQYEFISCTKFSELKKFRVYPIGNQGQAEIEEIPI